MRSAPISDEVVQAYQDSYVEQFERHGVRSSTGTRVMFTPLNGCGERTVVPILTKLGYQVEVPEGQGPDGSFAVIPLYAPNPEVPVSTQPARDIADRLGLNVVFAADPDADRLGMQYRDDDGVWHHVNGNQIATVLAYFITLDPEGPQLTGGVYQTLVTTLAVREIGRLAGVAHVEDDLYVGVQVHRWGTAAPGGGRCLRRRPDLVRLRGEPRLSDHGPPAGEGRRFRRRVPGRHLRALPDPRQAFRPLPGSGGRGCWCLRRLRSVAGAGGQRRNGGHQEDDGFASSQPTS